jgi:hypothetical protein
MQNVRDSSCLMLFYHFSHLSLPIYNLLTRLTKATWQLHTIIALIIIYTLHTYWLYNIIGFIYPTFILWLWIFKTKKNHQRQKRFSFISRLCHISMYSVYTHFHKVLTYLAFLCVKNTNLQDGWVIILNY